MADNPYDWIGVPDHGTVLAFLDVPRGSRASRGFVYVVWHEKGGQSLRLDNLATGGGTSDDASCWSEARWVPLENGRVRDEES